jgi:protein-S-isoprenylcysteine O-methyltransferase Ste14
LVVLWSVTCFIKAKGTPVPFNPPKDLVTTGPYARVRNPMIMGVFIILFGIGIYLCSYSLILLYLPAFIFLNYMELKKVEEPELEKRLGERYLEYKNKTSMFLPWRVK